MNARTFEARPAVRESVPLLVGLMGCSGSGKTFSALRLATGIQAVSGGDIYGIDTEARRMLHYADDFKFKHVEFGAPFGSLDYLAAIEHCVKQGARVIVIDSMSHEHFGPGGYLMTQEAELDRMAGNDYAKRERVKMAAWIKPSGLRQRMIAGILQQNVNLIFCFRAREKTKPGKDANGKTVPIDLGFMPVAGEELLFEMTANCLLMPKSNGVPTWRSDQVGEKMMMKLPRQFQALFADGKPLDENTGRALAQWAAGTGSPPQSGETPAPSPSHTASTESGAGEPDSQELAMHDAVLDGAAKQGMDALKAAWVTIRPPAQHALQEALRRRHKPMAQQADEARAKEETP
jgi:ABC-type dipeptide/oligopeptide/nickel transport system ATPase subunit